MKAFSESSLHVATVSEVHATLCTYNRNALREPISEKRHPIHPSLFSPQSAVFLPFPSAEVGCIELPHPVSPPVLSWPPVPLLGVNRQWRNESDGGASRVLCALWKENELVTQQQDGHERAEVDSGSCPCRCPVGSMGCCAAAGS